MIDKLLITSIVSLLMTFSGTAQLLSPSDSLALKIKEQDTYTTQGITSYVKSRFTSDSARVRALFVWVANNISYDVERLRSTRNPADKLTTEQVLKTRKALCQGYAELFVELLNACNVSSFLVPGYGKLPNGTISERSHAWVAAELSGKWWLFDPTWSAGVVKDDQFIKKFSNQFYKVPPEEMINHHMPFDPLHQFLFYPITANEFYEGKTVVNLPARYFNYADSLKQHLSLSDISQRRSTIRRIQQNGLRNDQIRIELDRLTKNQEAYDTKRAFDSAANLYTSAIDIFNRYIKHKNARFASIKQPEIKLMMDSVNTRITTARLVLQTIIPKDQQQEKILYDTKNALYEFNKRVENEIAFVKTYLAKGS